MNFRIIGLFCLFSINDQNENYGLVFLQNFAYQK